MAHRRRGLRGSRRPPRGLSRTLNAVKTTPRITRRRVDLTEVRAQVAAFEAAHPGVGADNYPDAFRDETGQLIESEEFFVISRLYGLLQAAQPGG